MSLVSKKVERQQRLKENHAAQSKFKLGQIVAWVEDRKRYGVIRSFWGKEHVIVYSILSPDRPHLLRHLQQVECAELVEQDGSLRV